MPAPVPAATARHQRSQGVVDIAFKRRGDRTVIDRWHQQGSAKVRLPRGAPPEAVLINLAGGMTGGDDFAWRAEWLPGTTAVVTSQAAEKIYRAIDETDVNVTTSLIVGRSAAAEWLPQETIVFDGGRLRRRTDVEIEAGGRFFGVETLLFGRQAMGETVGCGAIFDVWNVRRDGRLLLCDPLRMKGHITQLLARPAVANGATAVATAIYVGDDAAQRLPRLRQALEGAHGQAAASCMGDLLVARFLAKDGVAMRHDLGLCFECCRISDGRLPRQWRI